MKLFLLAAVVVVFISMPLSAADPPTDGPFDTKMADGRVAGVPMLANDMWRAFGDSDPGLRQKALETYSKPGGSIVSALVMVLDRDDQTRGKLAREALFRMVHKFAPAKGNDENYRNIVVKQLVKALESKNYKVQTRRTICEALSFAGDDTAVEVLADALDDAEIRDMARWALIRIPGEKAVDGLAKRVHTDETAWRVSLINALGQKGDRHAVKVLAEESAAENEAVRDAALEALARIPHKDAHKAIREALEKTGKNAGALLLRVSDTLYKAGLLAESEEALTVSMMAGLELTEAQICEQMFGLGRVGSEDAATLLLDELNHQSPRVRGAVIQASLMLKGESATTAIAKKMAEADAPTKIALLGILGQRGSTMTNEAAELIIKTGTEGDEPVRLAAIAAVEKAGIESGVQPMVNALGDAQGPTRDAIEHALAHMPGEAATRKIAEAAAEPSPMRAKLILALGQRRDATALQVISDATKDKDVAVRVAAFTALGSLQSPKGVRILVDRLKGEPGEDYEAAIKALARLQDEEASARMQASYHDFPEDKRAGLLRVIGRRKNALIVELLAKESKSENQEIRAAALEGIGYQDDPKAAAALLEAAKQGPAPVTEAAIGGYLRAARQIEDKDKPGAGKMYIEAIKLAVNDEQKRLALEGLDRTGIADVPELLPIVKAQMVSGNARAHAARVAARIALRMKDDRKAEIIEVLTAAIKFVPGDDLGGKIMARLRELGVDVDPARDAGFIVDWWLIGPFPNPDDAMWDKAYGPEKNVDLQAPEKAENAEFTWKKYHSPQFSGAVDLEKAIARRDGVGAYAYAEVVSDKEQDALLKIGSDDSIVVWLNGEKVHANRVGRGLRIDQDEARVHLKAGVNKILLKVLNGAAEWAFSIRAVTPAGEPIPLKLNPQ